MFLQDAALWKFYNAGSSKNTRVCRSTLQVSHKDWGSHTHGFVKQVCSSCLTWTFEDSSSCCVNLQCFAGPKYVGIIQKSSCVIGVPHFICAFWLKRRSTPTLRDQPWLKKSTVRTGSGLREQVDLWWLSVMANLHNPHCKSVEEVLKFYKVDAEKGLSSAQVEEHRAKYGPNALEEQENLSWNRQLQLLLLIVWIELCHFPRSFTNEKWWEFL